MFRVHPLILISIVIVVITTNPSNFSLKAEIFAGLGMIAALLFTTYMPISEIGQKIKLSILLLCIATSLLIPAYLSLMKKQSVSFKDTEKEYVEHFQAGYKCYQNRDYECSLREYQLAENLYEDQIDLYVYIAWTYEALKDYNKAIEYANKALNCKDNKTINEKAQGYLTHFSKKVSIYTILGDSNRKLENYPEAIEAYTQAINNNDYKYQNTYFKRGRCKYYIGEKEKALQDFYLHREIVNKYIQDQEESEYKSKYPTYDQSDLQNINKWINKATK